MTDIHRNLTAEDVVCWFVENKPTGWHNGKELAALMVTNDEPEIAAELLRITGGGESLAEKAERIRQRALENPIEVPQPNPRLGPVRICKGPKCGAEIVWVFTERYKRTPVDPDPVADGMLTVVGQHMGSLKVHYLTKLEKEAIAGQSIPLRYNDHHVTCPDAEGYRKR